ncbi:LXG domain of WXG superfamily protein [Pseudobutyrivibrio sp. OR37]|uniref:T7SS effector LXG polymorphic toxin n=1 Tax=Pseudobutyrivibrio sp. OR37 TaxID=1798186 RepID=UPI0008EF3AA7|nr:T7SS effector LXG polymorphic toxin [Pseudobutyrivibrio sp. OR37]SFI09578.1 LXG domain of WXG superfamily protein [Pseudobutyrivibrio sp. OR37]
MEGKNYKVSFLETLSAYNTAVTRISEIQDILEKLSEDITNVINSEDFTGTAADNIKTYASEIHLPLISAVATMLVDYQSKLLLYETNYFGIDSDYATKFNAETMAQVQEQVRQYLTDNETISSEMQTSLNSVSDIVSLPLPSKETVDFDLNWMIQKIDNLDESIVNYENLHSTDLDSLTDFIANLELFITYYQESIKPGDYKSGDCANNMYAYQLYESMQLSQEFLKNHEADINAAGEKLQQVADQMQADYDAACQARIDQGRAEIIKGLGVAFIGGVAIVASGGAATPLVAGALCMTGTCVFGYGLSNAMEGVDDVYYGMKGDLSSYAFNPLRDTIFMGNQEIYDLWGQANTIAVSILMPASSAYSEALAAGKTGFELSKAVYVAVAKEYAVNLLGDEATGLTVDFIDQHVGLNQTQQAAAEIFIGALIDPGTYESIGNFAGKFKAKPDGPSLNDIAHESLLPDNEINFTDFMSAEDAARYNAWNADCANGTHNNFPGLKDVDIEAWKSSDGQIATATAMSRIDGSELLKLRGESVKVDVNKTTAKKTRLPRKNGHWEGTPGESIWISDLPEVNKVTNGKGIPFKNGRPNFSEWSKGELVFDDGVLDGSQKDFSKVYSKLKLELGLSSNNKVKQLLRDMKLTPHHKNTTTIELLPTDLHSRIPHIGAAADMRNMR